MRGLNLVTWPGSGPMRDLKFSPKAPPFGQYFYKAQLELQWRWGMTKWCSDVVFQQYRCTVPTVQVYCSKSTGVLSQHYRCTVPRVKTYPPPPSIIPPPTESSKLSHLDPTPGLLQWEAPIWSPDQALGQWETSNFHQRVPPLNNIFTRLNWS